MSRKKRHNKKTPENDTTRTEADTGVEYDKVEVAVDSAEASERAEGVSSSVDHQEASPAGSSPPESDGLDGGDEPPAEAQELDGLDGGDEPPAEAQELDGLDGGDEPPAEAQELDRLAAEAQEMRLLAQRKQAELENYRKRVERERAETIKFAVADLMREILPVLDNLERAIAASKTGSEEQLIEGVEIIHKQFHDALTKQGLLEVEAIAKPFDPHVHEAVGRVETSEHPEGTVVEVLQKGYLYKDRLLRPSMVNVSQPAEGRPVEDNYDESVQEDENRVVPQEE
ncbi:MAG: nucleotide exchange factor GrpE [Acidobacteria bacterium]|nr:MAG: nucleotide exchange factor GrpE [Acidobacteriota bacterium]